MKLKPYPATVLFTALLVLSSSACAETLADFYEKALRNTAFIKEQDLAVSIAQEQKTQAQSAVLPTLSVQSNSVWRDQADVGAFGEAYQHSAFVSLSQPLFQGGGEYYALGIANNLPKVAELERERQKRILFSQVSQAFYQAFSLRRDRALYLEQEKALRERVSTLQRRAKIGRSKPTDVLAAQSQLARISAERANIERLYVNSENLLKNLTGINRIEFLADPLEAQQLQYNSAWAQRVEETPQIQAAELAMDNAKKAIGASRGTYLPSVDANANYYLDRAGILRDSEWDITVNAKWDLYNGGRDSSEVKIKRLQLLQMEARLTDTKRNQANEFESLKNQFFIHKKTLDQFNQAVRLAEKNYKQHIKEANQGLVSDIEALRVLDDFLQIRRTYEQQVIDTKITWAQMRALVGDLP